jgi:hypothetical protein
MKKEVYTIVRKFVKENPGASNSELASIIKEKSTKLKKYTLGTLKNYICKVKNADPREVESNVRHLFDDLKK